MQKQMCHALWSHTSPNNTCSRQLIRSLLFGCTVALFLTTSNQQPFQTPNKLKQTPGLFKEPTDLYANIILFSTNLTVTTTSLKHNNTLFDKVSPSFIILLPVFTAEHQQKGDSFNFFTKASMSIHCYHAIYIKLLECTSLNVTLCSERFFVPNASNVVNTKCER